MFKKILLSALMPMMIVTSSCSAEESEKNFNWEYFSTLNKDEAIQHKISVKFDGERS